MTCLRSEQGPALDIIREREPGQMYPALGSILAGDRSAESDAKWSVCTDASRRVGCHRWEGHQAAEERAEDPSQFKSSSVP